MKALFYKNYSLPYTKIQKIPIHATMPRFKGRGYPVNGEPKLGKVFSGFEPCQNSYSCNKDTRTA